MDMYNSEIISYSISRKPSSQAIVSALTQAIEATNDCKYRRTFHSDRGWAYQMKVYNKMLTKNKIFRVCHAKVIAMTIQSWRIFQRTKAGNVLWCSLLQL